jgi:hypothetical protein
MTRKFLPSVLLAIGMAWLSAATAAMPAAEVTLLTGKGTAAASSGSVRALAKGEAVYPGEIVSIGASSYVNLRFGDGSYVLLRPHSRFQIEQYIYEGAPVPPADKKKPAESIAAVTPAAAAPVGSRAFFRLLRGGFRAVSGLIGKGDASDYRVSTPVATIGIRGTDYETFLCDSTCQTDPVIREALTHITAGLALPTVMRANLRQRLNSGRLIKTQSGGNPVQVTYTHDGEIVVTDPRGKQIVIPRGTGAVTNHDGSAPFKEKPKVMGDTPDPAACD